MIKNNFLEFLLKIESIAKIGLIYSKDPYAIENYQEINDLTSKMLKEFTNVDFERPNYFARDIYPTPNISVRTVIFNELQQVLMVKESNTNLWSLPGGWCDLYDTPQEAAKKEISQEAGVEADITRLIGVMNRKSATTNINEYVVVFEGKTIGDFHAHCHETNDVQFFDLDNLPEISRKVLKEDFLRILDAAKNKKVIFD